MSSSVDQHRRQGPRAIACGVVTISDTRTADTDRGGDLVTQLLVDDGHQVLARTIVPDDPQQIERTLDQWIAEQRMQAILLTGGTGISPRDRTYDTLRRLLSSEIPGYGELFRMLSYDEIGPAAMLSRAIAGLCGNVVVLTMPGSPAAIRLAMQKIVLPELGHLVGEAQRSAS